ncbi:MAG: ester cyclase [Promethearchaeota archaeon]
MSIEENKANLHRVTEEVFNKGNLAVVDELVSTNSVTHAAGGEEFKGPEGFKQMVTMIRTAFPDFHMTIEDIVAEGDKLAYRYTWRGTHKGEYMGIAPTGKQVTVTGMNIVHFVGGKGIESWTSGDNLSMMQQLGVVPPMGQGGG